MSIQDDILDVQAAVANKPEAEAFDRIYTELVRFESEADEYHKILRDLNTGFKAVKMLCQGFKL
jgi:hypothetical protein